jgi:hypothetical protein
MFAGTPCKCFPRHTKVEAMSDKYTYDFKSSINRETGEITLTEGYNGIFDDHIKRIIKTGETCVQNALVALGWCPPKDLAALKARLADEQERSAKLLEALKIAMEYLSTCPMDADIAHTACDNAIASYEQSNK